ncbi:MAG: flagellin, partial [Candidatus Nitrotoga sp.]
MPSFINTNISSINAQRNLNTSQSALQTSLQRLSSGLRINGAKDDAAGLAISNRMTSQINGNTQAARNANDGISLAQTAEGDLNQIGTNLQRMRDLAIQSANATNSVSDRAALNNELQSLGAEIDRVAQNSSFNGVQLLDGSFSAQNFQVGAGATANDSIAINSISSARTAALGSAGTTSTATKVGTAITTALAAGDLTLNGQQVGASSTGIGGGLSTASATQVAVAINAVSATSGVTAAANSNNVTGAAATVFTAIAANTFSINGIDIGAVAAGGTAAGQGANVAAAINQASSQTGVTAAANALTGALTLTAADGRDVNVGLNGTAATATIAVAAKAAFLTQTGLLTANVGQQASTAVAGTVITAGAVVTPPLAGGTLAAGVLTANGASVGAVTYGTAANTAATAAVAAAAGTRLTISAGMTAGSTYTFTSVGTEKTNAAGGFSIVATGVANTDAAAILAAYNGQSAGNDATIVGAVITSVGGTFGIAVTSVQTAAEVLAGRTSAQSVVAATAAIATANAAQLTVSAGTKGVQQSNGAQYSGQEFAYAVNTALAAATGGAAVNGTATFNTGTGAVSYVAGSTNSLQFATTGATDAATSLAIQTATATQTGLTIAQLGAQIGAVSNAANHGTVTLTSTGANGIVVGGALSTNAGLTTGQTLATVVSSVSSVSAIDISTATGALSSLAVLDGALVTINTSRASLGAYQNRFASVVTSLQTTTENLTASRSRIVDTDFAAETASLSRNQILQQAGT